MEVSFKHCGWFPQSSIKGIPPLLRANSDLERWSAAMQRRRRTEAATRTFDGLRTHFVFCLLFLLDGGAFEWNER